MRAFVPLLLLLAIATLTWWWSASGNLDTPVGPPRAAQPDAPLPAVAEVAPDVPPARTAAAPTASEPDSTLRVYPARRERALLRGEVRDEFEQPVAGVRVELRPVLGSSHALLAIRDDRAAPATTTADGYGGFAFAAVAVGPYRLVASADDGRSAATEFAFRGVDDVQVLHLVPSRQPAALTVIVTDGNGVRVAGASVGVHLVPATVPLLPPTRTPAFEAATGQDGTCAFADAGDGALLIVARGPHGGTAAAHRDELQVGQREDALVLRLGDPGGIAGRLTGAAIADLADAEIEALLLIRPRDAYCTNFGFAYRTAVRGDAFAFADLPAGHYALQLRSPRGLRLQLEPMRDIANSVEPLVVEVMAALVTDVTVAVGVGGRIAGTVRTDDGTPVANAAVTDVLVPRSGNHADGYEVLGALVWRIDSDGSLAHQHPAAHAVARTDAAGRYELRGLPPGRHRVEVFAQGLSHDQRTNLQVAIDQPLELEHVLSAAGVVQGHLSGGSNLGIRPVGSDRPRMVAVVADAGVFTFAGLAAGDYELGRCGGGRPWVTLATVHVEAGATTWIDLDNRGPVRIAGVLRDGRGQPVQAKLTLYSQRTRSGSDGAFAFRLASPLVRFFEQPLLTVERDGQRWQLPFPDGAIGTDDWSGEFALGAASLAITLRDAGGQPLAGMVYVGGPSHALVAVAHDGRAVLSALLPGKYTLAASARDRLIDAVTVDVPDTTAAHLQARPCAVLDVLALDRDGQPRARAPITAAVWRRDGTPTLDLGDYEKPMYLALTNADGHAQLVVPAGILLVTTNVWDSDIGVQQIVQTAVAVPASVTLRLP